MLSFIHTGDLHLGRPFRKLGGLGKEVRKAQLQALKNIIAAVRQHKADFLLIAGDLFDANSVSTRLADQAMSILAALAPVPVYIQPGTHDVFDSASVYRALLGSGTLPKNVTIIPEEPIEFNPLPDVGVFTSANTTKRGGDRPLKDLSRLANGSGAKYKVAVVHASLNIPGLSIDPHEPLIDLEEIASSPFDYIAMGHWHRRQFWPQKGSPRAFYCGPPETLGFDDVPSPGSVTLVTLGLDTKVEEISVGTFRWIKLSMDVNHVPDLNEVVRRISQEAGPNTFLRLELKGDLSHDTKGHSWAYELGPDQLAQTLKERVEASFSYVEIDTDALSFHGHSSGEFHPNSVGSAFLEIMNERIEKAIDPAEKELLLEAMRRGSLYLSGKAVIR